jgi:hypothetical protein
VFLPPAAAAARERPAAPDAIVTANPPPMGFQTVGHDQI